MSSLEIATAMNHKKLVRLNKDLIIARLQKLNLDVASDEKILADRLYSAWHADEEETDREIVDQEEDIVSLSATSVTHSLADLCAELKLSPQSVAQLNQLGLKNADELFILPRVQSWPGNLSCITLPRDRFMLEDYITRNKPNLQPSVLVIPAQSASHAASATSAVTDLRAVINQQNGRSPRQTPVVVASSSTEHPKHSAHNRLSKKRSVCRTDSPGMSRSLSSHTKSSSDFSHLPTAARKLPRPHTFAFIKTQQKDKKKVLPTDISCNELFAGSARVIAQLAKKVTGKHAAALSEYSIHQEYLAQRCCIYSDESVVNFDDKYRRYAAFEKRLSF